VVKLFPVISPLEILPLNNKNQTYELELMFQSFKVLFRIYWNGAPGITVVEVTGHVHSAYLTLSSQKCTR